MPNLNLIREAVAKLSEGPPLVVVLSGGTTGIGSYVADSLGKTFSKHGQKLRVYIVGRNAARAEEVIARNRTVSPGSDWRFIQVKDLALISNVDRACEEISRQENKDPFTGGPSRVDLLYMSHCYPILKERSTTSKGLDSFISTTYYSRIRFIMQLNSLLTASPLSGHAISIYAGGFEEGNKPGELPMGTPSPDTYGVSSVRKHTSFMKTFMFEDLAEKYAGRLRLTHIYPGLVDGPTFYSSEMPTWFRVIWTIMKPLVSWYMTSPEDCGLVMLYLATSRFPAQGSDKSGTHDVANSTDGVPGGGCYSVGQRADAKAKGVAYDRVRQVTTRDQVLKHTMGVLESSSK